MLEREFVERIKALPLENAEEARSIYFSYCAYLKGKYGGVDKNFDEFPTKRGKEWLDIHHIMEYKLDDIARRTNAALWDKKYNGDSTELEKLKPYNVREQLVYANKIEHFLLHYLIDSMRGQKIFSGGPNFLWDCSIALAVYGFEKDYLNELKKQREQFYSLMSCEEITQLYKKLIDWKGWDLEKCHLFWGNYKYAVSVLEKDVSFVENAELLFKLFDLLDYPVSDEMRIKLCALPFNPDPTYRMETVKLENGRVLKRMDEHTFAEDGVTALRFAIYGDARSFTVPRYVKNIAEGAFHGIMLRQITIPSTVLKIEPKALISQFVVGRPTCPELKKIIYLGTREEWNNKFPDVDLGNLKLVCASDEVKPKREKPRYMTLNDDEIYNLIITLHNDVDKKSGGKMKLKNLVGLEPVKKIQLECKKCGEVQTVTMQEYETLSELHCPKCK